MKNEKIKLFNFWIASLYRSLILKIKKIAAAKLKCVFLFLAITHLGQLKKSNYIIKA